MQDNLARDVKPFETPPLNFVFRVGDYRVLFEIEGNKVLVIECRPSKGRYS